MSKKFIPIYIFLVLIFFMTGALLTAHSSNVFSLLSGKTLYTESMIQEEKENSYNEGLLANEKVYKENLKQKEDEINILNSEILYYKEMLNSYENIEKFLVTFEYEGNVIDSQFVVLGNLASVPEYELPKINNATFIGWYVKDESIASENSISGYRITQDTVFVAIYEFRANDYSGTFSSSFITSEQILAGASLDLNEFYNFEDSILEKKNFNIQVSVAYCDNDSDGLYYSATASNIGKEISFDDLNIKLILDSDNKLYINVNEKFISENIYDIFAFILDSITVFEYV